MTPVLRHSTLLLASLLALSGPLQAQRAPLERLPEQVLGVRAPSERVSGVPGTLRIEDRSCAPSTPRPDRQRLVDTAVQEWAYFGFAQLDYTVEQEPFRRDERGRRWSLLEPEQALRVADSIAGYWAAAPDSGWIVQRQNQRWQQQGADARWRDPWSAAFISWLMCENGLGSESRFARAVAHHTYIDQAIRARDGLENDSAYLAFDLGEQTILPGDLLCRGSRPAYRSLAERRRHLGDGARTHCDIVVAIDTSQPALLVIGGNVRGTVGMKRLPAVHAEPGRIVPAPFGDRQLFAHLQLQADAIPLDALVRSPTLATDSCRTAVSSPPPGFDTAPRSAAAGSC